MFREPRGSQSWMFSSDMEECQGWEPAFIQPHPVSSARLQCHRWMGEPQKTELQPRHPLMIPIAMQWHNLAPHFLELVKNIDGYESIWMAIWINVGICRHVCISIPHDGFWNLIKWIGFWELGPQQSETNWSALLHAAKHQITCSNFTSATSQHFIFEGIWRYRLMFRDTGGHIIL